MDESSGLDCLDDWSVVASEADQDGQEFSRGAISEPEVADEYEPPPPSTRNLNRALFLMRMQQWHA